MGRFILRYQGRVEGAKGEVERLRALHGVSVIDHSSPRMVLVDAPEGTLDAFVAQEDRWLVSREKTYELPKPHPSLTKVRRPKKHK